MSSNYIYLYSYDLMLIGMKCSAQLHMVDVSVTA